MSSSSRGVFIKVTIYADILSRANRYLPGHIHAFYLEYVYYTRREELLEGRVAVGRAPGVYSERIQTGGQTYGTIAQST